MLVTGVCYWVNANFATTAFFYFVIVVLYSLAGNFRLALLISTLAGVALEFFFVEPVLSLRVSHVQDALELATFLVTAVTISYLSSRVKHESLTANSQREHVERLYLLAQQLLAEDPVTTPRSRVFDLFLNTFAIKAVCLCFDGEMELFPASAGSRALEEATRAAQHGTYDSERTKGEISVRRLQNGQGSAGAIGFEGLPMPHLIASPLAALAALMLERLRAHQSASSAAALAEAEVLRTAILDALAHEFKTPLATILAAVGGIQESGALQPAQVDLAQVVETEATRLGSLTTRLLRLARLDRENVKPRWSAIDLEDIVLGVVKRYSRLCPQRRYTLATHGSMDSISADPELLRLAVSQLLDNASKYSPEQSGVEVELERRGSRVTISVWNHGPGIRPEDRERIFERFYRGANAKEVPGTGLGLYVVKRITAAHGGTVSVESFNGAKGASVFRLTLPANAAEGVHV